MPPQKKSLYKIQNKNTFTRVKNNKYLKKRTNGTITARRKTYKFTDRWAGNF